MSMVGPLECKTRVSEEGGRNLTPEHLDWEGSSDPPNWIKGTHLARG